MKKILGVLSLVFAMNGAMADDIYLGVPGYGGNGCPQGTVSATLSPDAKSLSIIFDQFITEAGPSSGKTLDRKGCNIAIPVHVPQGFSLSIIGVDYRGFVSVPRGANARLTAEYFFAGQRGPIFAKQFIGPADQDYTFSNMLGLQAVVWSACGADVNLRVNANMLVQNRTYQDALATVDSADVNAGLVYHLQFRPCR
jgi:hypothetical protein